MVFKDIPKPALVLLNLAIRLIVPFQVILLHLAFYFFSALFKIRGKSAEERKVAIGVSEAARLIHSLGLVFPSRYTCVLDGNKFYKDDYDFGPYPFLARAFVGPVLLAYLTHTCETFVYISFTGYLADREKDLKFLKSRGKKIIMLFYGSDIRSLKKTKDFFDRIGEDTFANYLPNLHNTLYDETVLNTAKLADRYADLVFNWNFDQVGYLTKPALPWPYILELNKYPYHLSLPKESTDIKVLHCPSHNIGKGTPLVRAAIRKLKNDGYQFEYIELNGVSNQVVLDNLTSSHIVLQEFYCLTPGILGMEALALGNAVLMSANHTMNPELPQDSNQAWIPTLSWQIYDNLKNLLDNPNLIKSYAENGRKFVDEHYNLDKVKEFYQSQCRERGIPY